MNISFKSHNFSLFNGIILFLVFTVFLSCHSGIIKQESVFTNRQLLYIETFSREGQLIGKVYFRNGMEIMKSEYTNKHDTLRNCLTTDEKENVFYTEFLYDSGKLLKEIYSLNNETAQIREYQYNSTGLPEKEITYDLHNNKITTYSYKYDSLKRLSKKTIIEEEDVAKRIYFHYDQNGNLLSEISILDNDTLGSVFKKYDSSNKLTETLYITGRDTVSRIQYVYQRKNSIVVTNYIDDHGFLVRREITELNRFGKVKLQKITDYRNFEGNMKPVSERFRYKYSYYH